MSSDSLTPPPLSSPFKLVQPHQNIAPRSPRAVSASTSAFACTSISTSQRTRNGGSSANDPRRVSHSSKRSREAKDAVPEHNKRVRSGTPIELNLGLNETPIDNDYEGTDLEIEQGRAGPSNYAEDSYRQVEAIPQGTSEAGEGADSVLFSELVETQNSTVAPGSASTAIQGNMADYLPQPDVMVVGTEETEDLGEYREEGEEGQEGENEEEDDNEEDLAEGEGDGQQDVRDDELDESHDRQDRDEAEEDDEDGAETPQWLTEPHMLVQEPVDRMSRVLEGNKKTPNGAATSELTERPTEGFEEEQHRRTDDAEAGEEEQQWEMEQPLSPQSYHSGDTDEYEMDHRPVLERTAIKKDIRKFADSLTCLKDPETGEFAYRIVDRLGEGTFSSVYLGHDTFFHFYDNAYWTDVVDDMPRRKIAVSRSNMPVALKKILVTSSPMRIENELHILESLRGCRNVSKLITAFRERDQVIIVMPYHVSDDFRHFYRHMDTWATRHYMQTLMRALKDIHRRGIVHRDVKPANFLFHMDSCKGVLCDFGLAERYHPPHKSSCQHAPATLESLHGRRTKTNDTAIVEQAVYDARKRGRLPEGRLGFQSDDKRPVIKTNRAGTRGFRAPEVLLKCPDQTVSIDIWSAGVILLSILSHKFPVFNSNDDTEALLEIAAIFGRSAMERCAILHNRTIISNIPTIDAAPESLLPVILRLNPHIYTPPMTNPTPEDAEDHIIAIDQAIDLCSRMLRLDATKRITAANALRHPFLEVEKEGDEGWEDMTEDEILDVRDGKCGHLHGMEGNRHLAFFGEELLDMHFGQGIPYSRTKLCPEHEHWQDRNHANVLAMSDPFSVLAGETEEEKADTIDVEAEDRRNGLGGEKPLVERDVNVEGQRRTVKGRDH